MLLEVKNLKTYFRTTKGIMKAVDDVSFELASGEALGLVGESGCGKTTCALSIAKLLPKEGYIESGEILLNGEDMAGLSEKEILGAPSSRKSRASSANQRCALSAVALWRAKRAA